MDTTPLQPSLEEVRALAAQPGIRRVPVKRELFADRITTIEAMRALRAGQQSLLLAGKRRGRSALGPLFLFGFQPHA